ncbi:MULTISPECIES: hybrid sensor histidine kinase/response regulator [unclassified Acidovorax]|uniref:hybrid sensor histidine kinase/response regulator n=1 Tax=unclassified Acidovorax TaxID=2684926 RepID=UPI002882EDE8|nr:MULTISPECIES: hybrid sensor histidine kinase/response regulator [unclassified Acidovorax]
MILAPSVARAAARPDRVKCLVVDDVEQNLIALEALLRRDDVEILKAASGPEALELLLRHNDVALALLDVQMPEMNGFELAELIRGSERTRHVPLIFMTAGSRDQNWQFKGYESGAVDFLYKPIDPHMLINKANVFFELQHQKQALAFELQERTEALRINDMFMAVLSHDLRGPLSAILASAVVLQRPHDADKVPLLAGKIQASGRRMSRMIEDLLDVTRARQAGGLVMQTGEQVDLAAAAQRTVQELRDAHPGRIIEVSQQGDLRGWWDIDRLCQVIGNLLGNAIHHGASDQPVQLRLDGTAACEVVFSTSNGGTIPPALLPHLFDPFRGSTNAAPGQHKGLGLGLYIVQQIVLGHGGHIEAASSAGRTVFQVRLPRSQAAPVGV